MPLPLNVELARYPRCGLCAYFPLEPKNTHYCPIYKGVRSRRNKPPSRASCKMVTYICFQPLTELAYETYLELRKPKSPEPFFRLKRAMPPERKKENIRKYKEANREKIRLQRREYNQAHRKENAEYKRKMRQLNPQKHKDEVKAWRKANPEYRIFRREIEKLDPMYQLMHRFRYTPKEGTGLDELLALEAIDFAPTEPYIPTPIPEMVIAIGGSHQKGGVDGIWKSHPDAYRKRHLKFARIDMQ